MEEQPKPTSDTGLNFAIFAFLSTVFCIALGMLTLSRWPSLNGAGMTILTALCGYPLALLLFIALKSTNKIKKPYQRYLFPALMIPLIAGLFIGWTLIQQSPTNMFKIFVADPIPNDVTDIHARDVTVGFDYQEIIFSFRATPEAIDEIIAVNGLELARDGVLKEPPHLEYLPSIDWNKDWILYKKDWSANHRIFTIEMWINPERNMGIYYFIGA